MKYIETEKIELKRSLNETLKKEVVAFLNTMGGVIYIGVEDNGTVCGVKDVDKTMRAISDIVSTCIKPNPQELVSIKALYEDNKIIVEVDVRKGKYLYYINQYGRSSKGCYIRMGTSCRSMTEEQIEKEFKARINAPSYSLINERSPKQNLTFRVFKIYLDENKIYHDEQNFNENNNFLTEKNEYNYLAFLLSDQCDISIKIACWKGNNKLSKYLFKKEFGGCSLLKAMDDLSSYMQSTHNQVKSFFDTGKLIRRDEFLFDYDSFREAWVNACLHNDYSTHLGPTIFLFNDHLEVFSYGSPLKVQTREKFLKGISKPINPELAAIFMKIGEAEESGKGINTIINTYGEKAIEISETDLIINIPYNKSVIDSSLIDNETLNETLEGEKSETLSDNETLNETLEGEKSETLSDNETLNETLEGEKSETLGDSETLNETLEGEKSETQGNNVIQKKDIVKIIKDMVEKNNKITKTEMAEKLGVSKITIYRYLKKVKNIKYIGYGKKGYWQIEE